MNYFLGLTKKKKKIIHTAHLDLVRSDKQMHFLQQSPHFTDPTVASLIAT